MNVREIHLHSFMSHDDSRVELPARGLVLVVGGNGSGKSAIIEGVACAQFGRTLRGKSPWRKDEDGEVTLRADGLEVVRRRVGGKPSLSFRCGEEGGCVNATATKAQEALDRVVGSFDIWRRTSVLSSADMASFAGASDGERKRLLEALLGIDVFDVALDACRCDLKVAEAAATQFEYDTSRIKGTLESAERRIADAEAALAGLPAAPDPGPKPAPEAEHAARLAKVREALRANRGEYAEVRRRLDAARQDANLSAVKATQEENRLAHVKGSRCPTCTQDISAALRERLLEPAKQASAAHVEAAVRCAEAEKQGKEAAADLDAEGEELKAAEARAALAVQTAGQALRAWDEASRLAVRTGAERGRLEGVLKEALASRQDAQDALGRAEGGLREAREGVGVLRASERVLGLRGVRAQVLGRALAGLEEAANLWLGRVAGEGLRLSLKSYSERKSGAIADALSLEVLGAGGGEGYMASSGGERRRIDVALLFALADVARAAHGAARGDLWCDECFDALDADGTEAVVAVLRELARESKVVVISHSAALAEALQPDLRLQVAEGRVAVLG